MVDSNFQRPFYYSIFFPALPSSTERKKQIFLRDIFEHFGEIFLVFFSVIGGYGESLLNKIEMYNSNDGATMAKEQYFEHSNSKRFNLCNIWCACINNTFTGRDESTGTWHTRFIYIYIWLCHFNIVIYLGYGYSYLILGLIIILVKRKFLPQNT